MSKTLPIPQFASEAEERQFWLEHDSTLYLDWSKAQRVRFPNLKPSGPSDGQASDNVNRRSSSRPQLS